MAASTTLLKLAIVVLLASSQITFCEAIQSQDVALVWNVTDQLGSTYRIFRFSETGFSEFYRCLCRNDTEVCIIARSPDTNEYMIYGKVKNDAWYNFEKPYRCYLQTSTTGNEIFCARILQGRCSMSVMCITYKSLSNISACDEDTVEIVSTYVTNVNVNVNDWSVEINKCHTGSTLCGSTTFSPPSSFNSKSPTSTLPSMSKLSYSNTHATSTVFTPGQTQSTSIDFSTKPTQSVFPSSAFQTVITSEMSTVPPNNTALTEDEDDSNNLVAIIIGVAVGVVVIIAIVIIIGVTFWRRRKRNPTPATSRSNHRSPAGDYENIYENQMAGVGTTSLEVPSSNTTETASYYNTTDIVHKQGNKQVQSDQHNMNTLDKNGHAKNGDFTGHVAQYYNFLEIDQIDSAPPQVSAVQFSDNKEEMGSTYENAIDNADGTTSQAGLNQR